MKKCIISIARLLCLLLIAAMPVRQVRALELPIRISVNFILDASDNRPGTGDINTDAQVNDQVDRGNEIFKENGTEYRFHLLGINEVFGEEAFFGLKANGNNGANRDLIRNAALADPTTWHWRTDAINIYINGGSGSATSDFPPDNNIIMINQNIYETTVIHEVGHTVNLYHTHQSGGDACSDTLYDNGAWTSRDQISQYSYSLDYDDCSAAQQALVDNTWENLMSYHDGDDRHIITPQQNDRVSDLTWDDRTWLLTDTPVYIKDGASSSGANGSWDNPYPTIQAAINAGNVNNRTLVLMSSGSHDDPSSVLDTNTDLITRQGSSTIQEMAPKYELRHDLGNSTNSAVAAEVKLAQKLMKEGDEEGSLAAIRRAAELAKGKERHALLIEIGDRLKAMEMFDEAEAKYAQAAEESDQPGLKKRFGKKAGKMKELKAKKLKRIEQQKDEAGDSEEDQP